MCLFKLVFSIAAFSMLKSVIETAKEIAAKSPVAVQGTKKSLIYSRDHTVQEGLDHIVTEKKNNNKKSRNCLHF